MFPSFEKDFRSSTFIVSVIVAIVLAVLAQMLYWSDSEMWAATVARGLFTDWSESSYILKPLFYFLLWASYQIADLFEIWPMHIARGLFYLNALAIAGLTFNISKSLKAYSPLLPYLVLLTLGSSSLFLERSFDVRSDLLISSLILSSILLLSRLTSLSNSPQQKTRQQLLALIPALLASFVSLNALFFYPLLIPFISWRRPQRRSFWFWALSLSILAAFIYKDSVNQSFQFLSGSLTEGEVGLPYFSPLRFEHVFRWIKKDPHLFLMVLLKLVHDGVAFVKRRRLPKSRFNTLGYWVLLLMLFHPNRLPFFLLSLLPFLVLWCFELPSFYAYFKTTKWWKPGFTSKLCGTLLFLALAHVYFHSKDLLENHSNKEQKFMMEHLAQLIPQDHQLRIFDPVGLLPFHSTYLWYLGPGQLEENKAVAKLITIFRPHLILATQRIAWIQPLIETELKKYQRHGDIFLRISQERFTLPLKKLDRETLLRQIYGSYGGLVDNDWEFQFNAFDENRNILELRFSNYQEKVYPLTGGLALGHLLFLDYIEASKPISLLQIRPQLNPKWLEHPEFRQLFRFDADL